MSILNSTFSFNYLLYVRRSAKFGQFTEFNAGGRSDALRRLDIFMYQNGAESWCVGTFMKKATSSQQDWSKIAGE